MPTRASATKSSSSSSSSNESKVETADVVSTTKNRKKKFSSNDDGNDEEDDVVSASSTKKQKSTKKSSSKSNVGPEITVAERWQTSHTRLARDVESLCMKVETDNAALAERVTELESKLECSLELVENLERRLNDLGEVKQDDEAESTARITSSMISDTKKEKAKVGNMKPELLGSKSTAKHPHVKGPGNDPRWHGKCHHVFGNGRRCSNGNARFYCTLCSEEVTDKTLVRIFCNYHIDDHIRVCTRLPLTGGSNTESGAAVSQR